jgi:hypothetical protein
MHEYIPWRAALVVAIAMITFLTILGYALP